MAVKKEEVDSEVMEKNTCRFVLEMWIDVTTWAIWTFFSAKPGTAPDAGLRCCWHASEIPPVVREKRKRSAFTPDSDSMFCDVRFSVFRFHVLHSQLSFFGTFYFGLVKLFLWISNSEVLSPWHYRCKFKLAVNEIDSALNFQNGQNKFLLCPKIIWATDPMLHKVDSWKNPN